MTENKTCRVCSVVLDSENWGASNQKNGSRICKECAYNQCRLWAKANPEKVKASWTKWNRKQGHSPFDENKECASYLGVHIAERVLSHVFKDVKRMPMNNPGYDVICNKGKLVDSKCSCQQKDSTWRFKINHNLIADFFLCLAFDNREDLTPLHAWLIPGGKVNHLLSAVISPSTIHKWDEYRLDTTKINSCCNSMR